jgi:glutamine amidotransferase
MADEVIIVDYEAGNLTSVRLAVQKLGHEARITREPEDVRAAPRLIFPGVGAAPAAMQSLDTLGLTEAIRDYSASGRPMLGICLGAQIILGHSEEGDVDCLGLIEGDVVQLEVPATAKVPHMGWNAVRPARSHALWDGITEGSQFYFVHSYAPAPASDEVALGTTDYYGDFVSAVGRANIVATQFHPERSGRVGLKLMENFLTWRP